MKFILGKKVNMTQVFDKNGNVRPATIVGDVAPLVVTQIKSKATDGYDAVQVGFGTRKVKNINKAQKGHSKDLGNFSTFKEFPGVAGKTYAIGEKIDVSSFKEGDIVEISAISKGKGFQGVVKRHGFGGGPRSHGQKHSEREPGSISGGTRNGGRVPKAMRMAGRMGSDRITVKNLTVLHVDAVTNQIFLEGAVPGKRGTLVEIRG
jgi:large subunit ribosomal protein L3